MTAGKRHTVRRGWQGFGLVVALTLTACNSFGLIPPSPTAPPGSGPIPLQATPLDTVGLLRARAVLTFGHTGWVHVTEQVTYDLDKLEVTTLPDGTPVPLQHTIETWANIAGNQAITQRVIYLRDGAGNIMQTSVYNNGVAWNSSTNQRENQTGATVGAFDRGFGATIGDYLQAGATVTQALTTLDGVGVIEIFIDHAFAQPANYGYYTQPVAGQRIRASFDQEGGQLRQLEWVMRLADGSLRQYGLWQITLEDDVTPPEDVLAVVEAVN